MSNLLGIVLVAEADKKPALLEELNEGITLHYHPKTGLTYHVSGKHLSYSSHRGPSFHLGAGSPRPKPKTIKIRPIKEATVRLYQQKEITNE